MEALWRRKKEKSCGMIGCSMPFFFKKKKMNND